MRPVPPVLPTPPDIDTYSSNDDHGSRHTRAAKGDGLSALAAVLKAKKVETSDTGGDDGTSKQPRPGSLWSGAKRGIPSTSLRSLVS